MTSEEDLDSRAQMSCETSVYEYWKDGTKQYNIRLVTTVEPFLVLNRTLFRRFYALKVLRRTLVLERIVH